jgi:hypothetical protein
MPSLLFGIFCYSHMCTTPHENLLLIKISNYHFKNSSLDLNLVTINLLILSLILRRLVQKVSAVYSVYKIVIPYYFIINIRYFGFLV